MFGRVQYAMNHDTSCCSRRAYHSFNTLRCVCNSLFCIGGVSEWRGTLQIDAVINPHSQATCLIKIRTREGNQMGWIAEHLMQCRVDTLAANYHLCPHLQKEFHTSEQEKQKKQKKKVVRQLAHNVHTRVAILCCRKNRAQVRGSSVDRAN